jgi:hypothetical protein
MEFQVLVVEGHLPARPPMSIGVLVLDSETDRLVLRFRTEFESLAAEDLEIIRGLPDLFLSMSAESGGTEVLRILTDTASNAFRVTDPFCVEAGTADAALDIAYRKFVLANDR